MARIKKQGLDYFPLDTDFMHQRAVRRLMKQHGDRAFTVLLSALSAIYGGEGYYVCFNDAFCEDLSTELFDTDARQVEDVLRTAVKCGLFDERLCREHGILTSAHIQEQYLYSSKRRRKRNLDERYRLVETDAEAAPARDDEETGHATQTAGNVTQTPENVTQTTENVTQTPQSKAQQSKAQQSKAQQSKKKPLPQGSPDNGGTAEGDGRTPPPVEERETHDDAYWLQRVGELNPPADGRPRNYDNLLMEMQRWRVPPQEQYAIILKSGFGLIGHPVWQGISEIVKKPKDIRQPGRFLLSKCK